MFCKIKKLACYISNNYVNVTARICVSEGAEKKEKRMYFFESIIELFCAISIPNAISQLNFRYKKPNVLASERNITVICN